MSALLVTTKYRGEHLGWWARKKVTFRFEKRNYFLNAVQRGSVRRFASTQIDFQEVESRRENDV